MQAPPPPATRGSLADRPAGAARAASPPLIPPPRPEMLIALQPSIWSRTPIPHKTVMGRAAGLLAVRTGGQQGGSPGTSVAPGRAQSALLPPPLTCLPPAVHSSGGWAILPTQVPAIGVPPTVHALSGYPRTGDPLGTRQWAGTGVSAPQAGSSSISVASLEAQAVPAARVTVWQEGPAGGHPLARPARSDWRTLWRSLQVPKGPPPIHPKPSPPAVPLPIPQPPLSHSLPCPGSQLHSPPARPSTN